MKPRIIITSGADDDGLRWLSDGWNSTDLGTRGTAKAKDLMAKAGEAITQAADRADAIQRLEAAGFDVRVEEVVTEYPREDVCEVCGAHVGWIISEMGEMFALGLCDDHLPEPEEDDDHSDAR